MIQFLQNILTKGDGQSLFCEKSTAQTEDDYNDPLISVNEEYSPIDVKLEDVAQEFDKEENGSNSFVSIMGWFNDFLTILFGAKNNETEKQNTLDGKIDSIQQQSTGDCGLLSGVNSLSYTQKGKQIIENALEYSEDGSGTTVHTIAGDYFVSKEELQKAKASGLYSSGDDDMVVIEYAIEQIRQDLLNGKIILSFDAPKYLKNITDFKIEMKDKLSLDFGSSHPEIVYYLTGKTSECIVKDPNSQIDPREDILNEFEANINPETLMAEDIALSTGTGEGLMPLKVADINGNNISLPYSHAYAIKRVETQNINGENIQVVTVTDPHDSSIEIQLDKETFLDTFCEIYKTDLSDQNQTQTYIYQGEKTIKENNDGTITQYVNDKDGRRVSEIVFDKSNQVISAKLFNENGNIKTSVEYPKDMEYIKKEYQYYQDGSIKSVSTNKCFQNYIMRSTAALLAEPENANMVQYIEDKDTNIHDIKRATSFESYYEDGSINQQVIALYTGNNGGIKIIQIKQKYNQHNILDWVEVTKYASNGSYTTNYDAEGNVK